MEYTKQSLKNGEVLKAEHLDHIEDGILNAVTELIEVAKRIDELPSDGGNIPRIESLDQNNLVNLRDLESGTYILYGKFRPYAGASNILTFSSSLLVNVITKTAGTHVQVFYPVNNVVQFLAITDTTYERTDVKLNDLGKVKTVNGVSPDTNGNVQIEVSGGETGGYYTPSVSQTDENTMTVSFTPSVSDMPAIEDQTITLPSGATGATGADGYTPVKGVDYFTETDKTEIVSSVLASLPSETWTFTLEDESTIDKTVVVV